MKPEERSGSSRRRWRRLAAGASVAGALALTAGALPGLASAAARPHHASAHRSKLPPLVVEGSVQATFNQNFNPFLGTRLGITEFMYLPLMGWTYLSAGYTPMLATGFKKLSSTETAFFLKPGLHWSNGKPLTSKDVVFTFELMKKNPALDQYGVWNSLASVKAKGPDEVIFTTQAPDSQAAPLIAQIQPVPESVWSHISEPTTFLNLSPTVTDGPYKLASQSPTEDVLVKNGRGNLQNEFLPPSIQAIASTDPTTFLDVQKDVFDWASTSDLPGNGWQKDFVSLNPKYNTYIETSANDTMIWLNNKTFPFDSLAVRQAVNLALNRPAIGKLENHFGYEAPVPETGLTPSEMTGLQKAVPNGGMITQNLSEAKSILTKAGYSLNGGQLVAPNGQPVNFTLQIPGPFADYIAGAPETISDLAQIGMHVTLQQPLPSAVLTNLITGQYQAGEWFGPSESPYQTLETLLGGASTAPIGQAATGNFERFISPQANHLLAEVRHAFTPANQDKYLAQLVKLFYDQVPVICLTAHPTASTFYTKNYVGFPSNKDYYTLAASPLGTAGTDETAWLVVTMHLKART